MSSENLKQDTIRMAKSDLQKLAEYARKLLKMIDQNRPIKAWQFSKIIKASDKISSVYHRAKSEMRAEESINRGPRQYNEQVKRSVNRSLKEAWKRRKAQDFKHHEANYEKNKKLPRKI